MELQKQAFLNASTICIRQIQNNAVSIHLTASVFPWRWGDPGLETSQTKWSPPLKSWCDFVTGHGECEAGKCRCFSGWDGDQCQCPSASAQHCVNSKGQVCSGRGTCVCGTCECTDSRSIGRFCEHCPTCHTACGDNWYEVPVPCPLYTENNPSRQLVLFFIIPSLKFITQINCSIMLKK